MVVYSFYIFDRHTECIYKKRWVPRPISSGPGNTARQQSDAPATTNGDINGTGRQGAGPLSAADDAKLVFGTIFSLRNMVRKLGGDDDNFISFRTGLYKLHYYETPTNIKFVMLTDTKTNNLRIVLHQIYVNLFVEFGLSRVLYTIQCLVLSGVVVKNPLSPVEHPGGEGVANELFELGLESFIVCALAPMVSAAKLTLFEQSAAL
ncbi:MAG: TRAPP subunit bet5 [Candelina submexicana]|nr:MAG: TRAPP subunit bet5 [Candelina submexicana]